MLVSGLNYTLLIILREKKQEGESEILTMRFRFSDRFLYEILYSHLHLSTVLPRQ